LLYGVSGVATAAIGDGGAGVMALKQSGKAGGNGVALKRRNSIAVSAWQTGVARQGISGHGAASGRVSALACAAAGARNVSGAYHQASNAREVIGVKRRKIIYLVNIGID